MQMVPIIGLDVAKSVSQAHGVDAADQMVSRTLAIGNRDIDNSDDRSEERARAGGSQ